MRYRINYFKKDGSFITVGDDFAEVLIRTFETPEELVSFSESLSNEFGFVLLEKLEDGSYTSYPN